jgi:putative flippase GtrA
MRNTWFQFLKYLLTGLLNSAIGLTLIYACMSAGLGDVVANVIGYAAGFFVSFFVNNKWTFKQRRPTMAKFAGFLLVASAAYALNLFVMLTARDQLHIDHRIAQLLGVVAYTGSSFIGVRIFVFGSKVP